MAAFFAQIEVGRFNLLCIQSGKDCSQPVISELFFFFSILSVSACLTQRVVVTKKTLTGRYLLCVPAKMESVCITSLTPMTLTLGR